MNRREDNVRAVRITQELLVEMLTTGWKATIECIHGVPPDAEFVTAEIEPRTGDALYIFWHPDFPQVAWDDMSLLSVAFVSLPIQEGKR